MKKKNILYSMLNFVLIIFALFYIIPMFQSITMFIDSLFDVYEVLSVIIVSIFFIMFFVINLVMGILNIKNKNIAIGVLNIVAGCMALINIIFTIIYEDSYDDIWGCLILFNIVIQIIITFVNLILNRKKESTNLKKHSVIIFCIIFCVCTVMIIVPRVLLKINKDRLYKAYTILNKEDIPQMFIDNYSNFYDITGKIIGKSNYEVISANKIDNSGVYIITAMDNNNELWIIDYNGEKLVRLYHAFSDSRYLVNSLIESSGIYNNRYNNSNRDIEINYLTAEVTEDNYLRFTDENKEISIEVEIDKTQIEDDKSFVKILQNYYMKYYDCSIKEISGIKGINLESIYNYKKNYYLTYKNNERVKLECNNLIIDYDEEERNYILFMYHNWNIPFYDEKGSGFFNLDGKKYTVNDQYLVYNTFEKYIVLYSQVWDCYFISSYDLNDIIRIDSLEDCNENYVYADKKLYVIDNNKIENAIDRIKFEINVHNKNQILSSAISVYDYYLIK